MRKFILFTVFILSLLMIVSCSARNGSQGSESGTSQGDAAFEAEFVFTVRPDGTCELTRYNGQSEEVTVPSQHDGMAISSIGAFSFEGKDSIKRVVIPEGVTEIKPCAFAGCSALAELELPDSAVEFSKESFADTPWYSGFEDGFVIINGTVTEYRGDTSKLNALDIPEGTLRVGERAFSALAVRTVTLPESVTHIGERAFEKCTSLFKIQLPDGIEEIGYAAFHETAWFNLQKNKAVVVGSILVGCDNSSLSVSIPDNVKTIAPGAFLGSRALVLNIPEGVEKICPNAFTGCTQVLRITLPSTVTELDPSAFEMCPSLQVIGVAENNPNYYSKDGILYERNKDSELARPEGMTEASSETSEPQKR